ATLQAAPAITVPKKVSAVWAVGVTGSSGSGSSWTLDGKMFDPKRVVLKVPRGATQMWELRNPTNVTHYLHIHEEQWHTVLRDGKTPPKWERGLEDTWRLDPGERVRVVAKFTDFLGVFMIHCHMLDHEDDGLMAQFAVVDPKTGALPSGYRYQPSGGPAARARASSSTATARAVAATPTAQPPQTAQQPAPSTQATSVTAGLTDMSSWMCGPTSDTSEPRRATVQ
ncbi:MAG TPA: multicopper oxidase domain-containing protein, partial [Mycobacteriales bacterium]|nr:multicopper oxidase domain-containing protein [Mycobacteriales bacterium]